MVYSNKLPRFFELLREAQEAANAVDSFDLYSEKEESRKEWNKLLEEQKTTVENLVKYIRANKEICPQIKTLADSHTL